MRAYESVLIVTYGRTGSTLLQGLLNSVDGVVINGENNLFPFEMFTIKNKIEKTIIEYGADALTPEHPWFRANRLSIDKFILDARVLLENQIRSDLGSEVIWGFKEIRFIEDYALEYFEDFLYFMKSLMPKPYFIFLHRDFNEVKSSSWWVDYDHDILLNKIKYFWDVADKFIANDVDSFKIDYKDLTIFGGEVEKMFNYLGFEYKIDGHQLVINKKHSI
jgi:hypothetical protein